MKDINVYVVRTGRLGNLTGVFVSRDDAIEHIAGRIRENSGANPEVKLDGTYRVSVPESWIRTKTPRRVYVLLQHIHETSAGTILGFHTNLGGARKAMETRSRYFFEQGRDFVPRLKIAEVDLYAYAES